MLFSTGNTVLQSNIEFESINMYAKAKRPRLTKRPKASIWLVHHHLRSLNTVNEEHYMKNMSIERIT